MVALNPTTSDQDLSAVMDSMRRDELKFSDLVTRERGTR
jgi:hypothetical protein